MARTDKSSKTTALGVAQSVFEGLAPLLIELGITSPEGEALLRAVCVHEAARTLGTARRPNVSRVSVKTGVDRHTVAALLKSPPEAEGGSSSRRDCMSRVIDGWLSDPEYSKAGRPCDLHIGHARYKGRSLWSLVQRYAPAVWPRLIVDELIRVDYVETLPNGKLRWKRTSNPKPLSRRVSREGAGQRMRDAILALYRDATQPEARRTWRVAQSLEIGEQDLPLVRKMLRERLDYMFAWITDELNSTRWQHDRSMEGVKLRVGLSGFTFEEPLPKEVSNEDPRKSGRSEKR